MSDSSDKIAVDKANIDSETDQVMDGSAAAKDGKAHKSSQQKEYGGRSGPEPTRYGDWEKNGIISDF